MQDCEPESLVFVHYTPSRQSLTNVQISSIRSHAQKAFRRRLRWVQDESIYQETMFQHYQPGNAVMPTEPAACASAEQNLTVAREATRKNRVRCSSKRSERTTYVLPWASSRRLDPLKVLSPHLTDPELTCVWQEAVNVFWPMEQHVPMEGQEPFVWSFFKHSLGDMLLFNCMSAVLISLHDSRRGTTNHTALMLEYQNRAIGLLRDEVTESKHWRDEFLFALLCMTPGERDPDLLADPKPYGGFTPVGTEMQYLKSNGLLLWKRPHKVALKSALQERGGIASVKISGTAELMQGNDLVECSHTLSKPSYPLCNSYRKFLAKEVRDVRETHQTLCNEDLSILRSDIGPKLHDLFWDMRAYVDLLARYTQGAWAKVEMPHLATHRNLIQYRLLSEDLKDDACQLNLVALLGAWIFTYGVIYPLPDRKPQLTLAAQLRVNLELSIAQIDPDFLTWLLILGGIATADLEDQIWFSDQLAQIYERQIHADSRTLRKEVMKKMRKFVWMDVACNEGFLELWCEVENAALSIANAGSPSTAHFISWSKSGHIVSIS